MQPHPLKHLEQARERETEMFSGVFCSGIFLVEVIFLHKGYLQQKVSLFLLLSGILAVILSGSSSQGWAPLAMKENSTWWKHGGTKSYTAAQRPVMKSGSSADLNTGPYWLTAQLIMHPIRKLVVPIKLQPTSTKPGWGGVGVGGGGCLCCCSPCLGLSCRWKRSGGSAFFSIWQSMQAYGGEINCYITCK